MYLSTCNNKIFSSPRIWINFPIKNDLFVYLIIKIINGLGIFLSTSYLLSFTYIMYSNKVFLNILQMSNLLCFQLLRKKLYWIIHHYNFMYAMNLNSQIEETSISTEFVLHLGCCFFLNICHKGFTWNNHIIYQVIY